MNSCPKQVIGDVDHRLGFDAFPALAISLSIDATYKRLSLSRTVEIEASRQRLQHMQIISWPMEITEKHHVFSLYKAWLVCRGRGKPAAEVQ